MPSVSVFSNLQICSTENTNIFNHVETQCDIDAKSNNQAILLKFIKHLFFLSTDSLIRKPRSDMSQLKSLY